MQHLILWVCLLMMIRQSGNFDSSDWISLWQKNALPTRRPLGAKKSQIWSPFPLTKRVPKPIITYSTCNDQQNTLSLAFSHTPSLSFSLPFISDFSFSPPSNSLSFLIIIISTYNACIYWLCVPLFVKILTQQGSKPYFIGVPIFKKQNVSSGTRHNFAVQDRNVGWHKANILTDVYQSTTNGLLGAAFFFRSDYSTVICCVYKKSLMRTCFMAQMAKIKLTN